MSGRFVWYDLMTTDVEGAWAFYQEVVGFGREPFGDGTYNMLVSASGPIGGIEQMAEKAREMGAPAHWIGYVSVDDIDATAGQVPELGGIVHHREEIPEVGRFAVIQDPTGAVCAAFQSNNPDWQPSNEVARGAIVWHECYAGELDPAWDFYAALFGWKVLDTMTMQGGSEYRMYGPASGEPMLGGFMGLPPMIRAPTWVYYIHVDEITSATERVRGAGGTVVMGPIQIPGGEFVTVCLDPQGAIFALHSKVNASA